MLETYVCPMDQPEQAEEGYELASRLYREGQNVAFPTETVYGLGGWIGNDEALRGIYRAKGRPSDNPLIVHVGRGFDLSQIVREVDDTARALMEAFWPGPMTLILKKNPSISDVVTAGLDTVALRMPSHPVALRMLEKCGLPIAAPSANTSGRPSPTTAAHVYEDLKGKIPLILDGGSCQIGLESTIIDVTVKPAMILRPGGLTLEEIREVAPDVVMDPGLGVAANVTPKAPGMKYRHYAPKAKLYRAEGSEAQQVAQIRWALSFYGKEKKCVVLTTREHLDQFTDTAAISLGSLQDHEEMAANLFDALRNCDEGGYELIFSETIGAEGIGAAFMNRLRKASSGTIADLR